MPDKKTLSPAEVAERLGVGHHKVLRWIVSGELRAINCASTPYDHRTQWRIYPSDLAAFEDSRAAVPVTPKPRRRRRPTDITQYI